MGLELEQERELVERARSDIQAFGLLYDEYYNKIFGYVLRRTASINITQDITSEVFYKALKNISKFKWRAVPFSAWLYRIATNEIADHYNRNSRNKLLEVDIQSVFDLSQDSVEAEVEQAERDFRKQKDILVIHSIICQLPVQYQEIIALRYFEKKGLSEIAGILGKREGAVKSLLHRSLKKMRKIMGERETI
jgi:RNA polymerase sigma-70 factor (ECF subfamily)